MPKIILEIIISYFVGTVTFEKEGEFIPIPGMIIKFPDCVCLGDSAGNDACFDDVEVNTNPDFFPEWDMEKNEVKCHIKDINTEDLGLFRKRVQGLMRNNWKITDTWGVEEELKGIIYGVPDSVEYKHIKAVYNPKRRKATFTVNGKEIKRSRRS